MSYVSVYENKTPRSKGAAMAVAVHALIIAGAMAMPEIVAPEKFEGTIFAFPVKVQTPPEPVIEDKKPEVEIASPTRQTLPERPINIDVPDPFVPVNNYGDVEIKAGLGGLCAGSGDRRGQSEQALCWRFPACLSCRSIAPRTGRYSQCPGAGRHRWPGERHPADRITA